jgi:hypothetical protein
MITEKNRATSMVIFIMVALNGMFLFGNGLFMLVVPSVWYHFSMTKGSTSRNILAEGSFRM